jgi:hypothetical protein
MRSACHTWIQLIGEMDAAFDRSWPYDVAHAIRHAHTVWEAKDYVQASAVLAPPHSTSAQHSNRGHGD